MAIHDFFDTVQLIPKVSLTRSGVNGICRKRAPLASKMALASAAAVVTVDGSPAPRPAGSAVQ
jgi:hypothetical protein